MRISPLDLHKASELGAVLQEHPAKEGDTDQPRKKPNSRQISKVKISESVGTRKVAPDAIMSADSALAGQPKAILMRVAPGLQLNYQNPRRSAPLAGGRRASDPIHC